LRAVIQRVRRAKVEVGGRVVGSIEAGILVYLGVGKDDGPADSSWLAEKAANMRIFEDDGGKMNRSVLDEGGAALVVSQFTLYADARKGRRPSYSDAAQPEAARELYRRFVSDLSAQGLRVEEGEFQAEMEVNYTNMGPVTILLDSKKAF
jgi:D-tyrosyl-tRNA(Tyr) deacylase